MSLENHLAIIYNVGSERRFGAGMLVEPSLVLTCAHVVNAAIGRQMNDSSRPNVRVHVMLHASPTEKIEASLDDNVDAWRPPPATSSYGADLCLLRLSHPTTVEPAQLLPSENIIMREYRAAGYPLDWQGDLDIAIGEVVGRDEHGLYLLRPQASALAVYAADNNRLLRRNTRPAGVIHSGFSGGPVEVDGRIVGLIAEARGSALEATAYMVPMTSFPERILSRAHGSASYRDDLGFVSQFAPGPTVKERYLVTPALARACAQVGERRTEAAAILGRANQLRIQAGHSEEKDSFGLLEFFYLPNLDAGAISFWTECLLLACVMGPRMLASLLVAVPHGLAEQEAKKDREALLNVLLANYRTPIECNRQS